LDRNVGHAQLRSSFAMSNRELAKVSRLQEALADPETALEAGDDIRALVGRVILTPGPKRGQINAVLHGELGVMLQLVAAKSENRTPMQEFGYRWLRGPAGSASACVTWSRSKLAGAATLAAKRGLSSLDLDQ